MALEHRRHLVCCAQMFIGTGSIRRSSKLIMYVHQQLLLPKQGEMIVIWLDDLNLWDLLHTITSLRSLACEMVGQLCRRNWFCRSINRWSTQLESYYCVNRESKGREADTEYDIELWTTGSKEEMEERESLPQNVYSMDENGISLLSPQRTEYSLKTPLPKAPYFRIDLHVAATECGLLY